jgi:hypothetical protein
MKKMKFVSFATINNKFQMDQPSPKKESNVGFALASVPHLSPGAGSCHNTAAPPHHL